MLCHCDEGSNRKTLVKNYSSQVRRGLVIILASVQKPRNALSPCGLNDKFFTGHDITRQKFAKILFFCAAHPTRRITQIAKFLKLVCHLQ
jgi:hypothetical protein